MDAFKNPDLLTGIHTVRISMQTTGVEGMSDKTHERRLVPNYRDVWLNRNSLVNILSLVRVSKKFRFTFNSTNNNSFVVYIPNGVISFKCHQSGLYYYDVVNQKEFTMVNRIYKISVRSHQNNLN